ncbi:WD40 repeat domain-containing protein [archaeon]|nr:MAG: WD40 repeat domain-containing protein [archaeon]
MSWPYNDATLVTCAADGAIYEWDLSDGKRAREFICKGVRWLSASMSKNGSLVYAVGDGAGPDGTQCTLSAALCTLRVGVLVQARASIAPLCAPRCCCRLHARDRHDAGHHHA